MKNACAVLGILCVLIGTFCGALDWYLVNYHLESVGWAGRMVDVERYAWILQILGMGLGGVLIGFSALLRTNTQ